ncbi:MAG: hypothetical protein VW270_08460 [Candidatus Poseidoniales archaeon]
MIQSFLNHFDSYCWVAGGAVLAEFLKVPSKDIDVFFATESERERAVETLLSKGGTHVKKLRLGDSIEFEDKVYDLLHMGSTPQETIECFDYTVCSIAIDLYDKIYKHPDFDRHIEQRKLVYTGGSEKWFTGMPESVNRNIIQARRMARYLKKGFDIDDENIRRIFK